MRVYVVLVLLLICSLASNALADDDEHEVKLVGDKNFTDRTVVYDGIDVSNYQKDINWDATAKDRNIKYVYIKATEGATHKQHRYRKNIENARKHGIKVGSYHFLRTRSSIQSQFNNFISVVKPEEQDLVPLLDVETREGWTVKQLKDSVLKFARLLERHFGCKPMIYTSSSYFNNYLGETFVGYPLFIARYSKSEPELYYGAKWILWQFSDRGRIEGIDARVDLSRFNKGCSVRDIAYDKNKRNRRAKTTEPPRPERDNGYVPRPKPRKSGEQVAVPLPPPRSVVTRVLSKEEQEAQKRGEEAAQKRQREEQKALERLRKEEEKQRKEEEKQRKEIEKRQREIEKRRAAEEQKRLEQERKRQAEEQKRLEQERKRRAAEEQRRQAEEKKRLEQERKRQKEEAKERALQSAQERMRVEKENKAQNAQEKKNRAEQERRRELEQAKQERQQREQQQAKQQQLSASQSPASTSSKTGSGKTPGKRVVKGNNQSSADNEAVHYNKKKKTVWNN